MPFNRLPDVERCCGCVPDLKTASAIIAVLGIVTSPAVSWAVVRHSYVIRVSCYITTSLSRPDVIDVSLSNILSFGFGPNAGLGPTCLSLNSTLPADSPADSGKKGFGIVKAVRYVGWVVLMSDLVFLICSVVFLIKIFRGGEKKAAKVFILAALFAMALSFVYSMLYVSVCISMGGGFPVFEFLFALVDVVMWLYFLIVVNSYRRRSGMNPS